MKSIEWLAGILEGEGSFVASKNTCLISVEMVDRDVISAIAEIFGTSVMCNKARNENCQPTFTARVKGRKAVELMNELYPYMFKRRREAIAKAIANFKPKKVLPYSEAEKERAIELRRSGLSLRTISKRLGMSPETVRRVSNTQAIVA